VADLADSAQLAGHMGRIRTF